jgi:long-chain acyl-CoA synthetase
MHGGRRALAVEWRHGVPLPARRPSTLPELIARCVAEHGDRVVVAEEGRRASWRDLERWSGRLAGALASRLRPGERLAILGQNSLSHLVAELATWRLGAIAAPLFMGFGASRLREVLASLSPRAALIADPALAACLPEGCEALSPERLWQLAERTPAGPERPVGPRDACLIQHTSGSSGEPRGVVLCHDNLASQQAAFALLWPEVGQGDRLASYLPWHHSFGALAERLWALCRGVEVHLVPGGGRDRARFVECLRAVRPTLFMSVPKMHAVALAERLFARGQLRWAFTAGAPLPEELFAAYAAEGIALHEGWGLTESSPSAVITPPGAVHRPRVVGQPIPGVSVGVEAASGRILVRGPNLMLGYWGRGADCLLELDDGIALDSGDLGVWTPDGLELRGRADHVLKLANGEKVCAPVVESALAHPAIHHAVALADGALAAIVDVRAGHDAQEVVSAALEANAAQGEPWLRLARIYLAAEPWTIENGMITASMKVSRGAVVAAWRSWREGGGEAYRCLELRTPPGR